MENRLSKLERGSGSTLSPEALALVDTLEGMIAREEKEGHTAYSDDAAPLANAARAFARDDEYSALFYLLKHGSPEADSCLGPIIANHPAQ